YAALGCFNCIPTRRSSDLGGILAVRVDHHDVALRRAFADAVQNQRRTGGLAGAGRTQQREMLAEHRIDIKPGADVAGGIDGADLDRKSTRLNSSHVKISYA